MKVQHKQPYQCDSTISTCRFVATDPATTTSISDSPLHGQEDERRSDIFLQSEQEHQQRVERRHAEMRQVLEEKQSTYDEGLYQRIRRYPRFEQRASFRMSEYDATNDGVHRVHRMLDRMIRGMEQDDDEDDGWEEKASAADPCGDSLLWNEETFQIVMRAYLKRDRLYWLEERMVDSTTPRGHLTRRNVRNLMCVGDALLDLLDQFETLRGVEKKGGADGDTQYPSIETYMLVLEGLSMCSTPEQYSIKHARAAEAILERILSHHGDKVPEQAYAYVIQTFVWSHTKNTAQDSRRREEEYGDDSHYHRGSDSFPKKAQHYLNLMEERMLDDNTDGSDKILMTAYLHVLEGWSRANCHGVDAQLVWNKICKLSTAKADAPIPIPMSANTNLIVAWSKSIKPSHKLLANEDRSFGVEKAHTNLKAMVHRWRLQHSPETQADTTETEKNSSISEQTDEEALNANNICLDGPPSLFAFTNVLKSWSNLRKPRLAENVFRLALQVEQEINDPSIFKVNAATYCAVICAYFRQAPKVSPTMGMDRIDALISEMENAGLANVYAYTIQLRAYMDKNKRHNLRAEHAEGIWLKMLARATEGDTSYAIDPRKLRIDPRNLNVVLHLFAKGNYDFATSEDGEAVGYNRITASHRAVELLNEARRSKHFRPDVIAYSNTLECILRSQDANATERSFQLLRELEEDFAFEQKHLPKNEQVLELNVLPYTIAIRCLAASTTFPEKAQQAEKVLERILEASEHAPEGDDRLRPNNHVYNNILNCAANTVGTKEEQLKAFSIATKTYQRVRSEGKPDSFTYGFWMKACNNLLPSGGLYEQCITLAFKECCENGLLTEEVWRRVKQAQGVKGLRADIILTMLGLSWNQQSTNYNTLTINDFPPEWSMHAAGQNRRSAAHDHKHQTHRWRVQSELERNYRTCYSVDGSTSKNGNEELQQRREPEVQEAR